MVCVDASQHDLWLRSKIKYLFITHLVKTLAFTCTRSLISRISHNQALLTNYSIHFIFKTIEISLHFKTLNLA